MSFTLKITQNPIVKGTASLLPASKSISNRVLIMDALSGNGSVLNNLSDANDTQLMMRLVRAHEELIDVEDAGTTMRFLTAYFSITNQTKALTGTARMRERPIGILVDALRSLGASIRYLEKEGFPPLRTEGFQVQRTASLRIRGDVSSQYISALMMIAPTLPQGLTLELEGKIGSRPYIEMTASLLRDFGIESNFTENVISIAPQRYRATTHTVESDWSAASYWFAFAALADEAEILLPRLHPHSLQGDSAIQDIMQSLGVTCERQGDMLKLTKHAHNDELNYDFTKCPDLAQTVAVVCAAKGVRGAFTGLESLRIKETDRIAALQDELAKIGASLVEHDSAHWSLIPSSSLPDVAHFATYKDHRMAMAFAPLATRMEVLIENPLVVRKSYPNFWNDMRSLKFLINEDEVS